MQTKNINQEDNLQRNVIATRSKRIAAAGGASTNSVNDSDYHQIVLPTLSSLEISQNYPFTCSEQQNSVCTQMIPVMSMNKGQCRATITYDDYEALCREECARQRCTQLEDERTQVRNRFPTTPETQKVASNEKTSEVNSRSTVKRTMILDSSVAVTMNNFSKTVGEEVTQVNRHRASPPSVDGIITRPITPSTSNALSLSFPTNTSFIVQTRSATLPRTKNTLSSTASCFNECEASTSLKTHQNIPLKAFHSNNNNKNNNIYLCETSDVTLSENNQPIQPSDDKSSNPPSNMIVSETPPPVSGTTFGPYLKNSPTFRSTMNSQQHQQQQQQQQQQHHQQPPFKCSSDTQSMTGRPSLTTEEFTSPLSGLLISSKQHSSSKHRSSDYTPSLEEHHYHSPTICLPSLSNPPVSVSRPSGLNKSSPIYSANYAALSIQTGSLPVPSRRSLPLGQSSTLPHNSTLSSLLAAAAKSAKSDSQKTQTLTDNMRNMNETVANLRRQNSLGNLNSVNCASKTDSIGFGSSIQQKIKAMLGSKLNKANSSAGKNSKTASTYRAGDDFCPIESNNTSDNTRTQPNTNGMIHASATLCAVNNTEENVTYANTEHFSTINRARPLSTLNKFTISMSSHNLCSSQNAHLSAQPIECYEDEENSFNLRNVCNKLYSQKHYSSGSLHYPHASVGLNNQINSSSNANITENVDMFSASVQKSSTKCNTYRNMNAQNSINKLVTKECLYSNTNNSLVRAQSKSQAQVQQQITAQQQEMNHKNSTQVGSNGEQITSQNSVDANEHVVVVSELQSQSSPGLTVRTDNSREMLAVQTNDGSSLSLHIPEGGESVASNEHNYKSSSESGRGTMNSHREERSPNTIDLNSPPDLTSLDSDQSHHHEEKESKALSSQMQRYLDQHQQIEQNEICQEFQSKMVLTPSAVREKQCWSSLSEESPATLLKKCSLPKHKQTSAKMRSMTNNDSKAQQKTNFSNPNNCYPLNSKGVKARTLPSQHSQHQQISPALKASKANSSGGAISGVDEGGVSLQQDKSCIYSVPNKGKYRALAQQFSTADPNAITPSVSNSTNLALAEKLLLNFAKDCDETVLSSDDGESHLPEDGCSEFTDFTEHNPLRKQLRGIEEMYSELLTMLHTKDRPRNRKAGLVRRNSGRSSVVSRGGRDIVSRRYRSDHRRTKNDDILSRRHKKLESQVLTLAKSVSQLSADVQFSFVLNEEIENMRHEFEMVKSHLSSLRQTIAGLTKNAQQQQQTIATSIHQQQQQQQQNGTLSRNKDAKKPDSKLKRLFADEPQPMKQFLKRLGYEKYCKHFESEKIGLAELVHLNEERLQKLGIPMGPRIRILQEARNLRVHINGQQQHQQQSQQQQSNHLTGSVGQSLHKQNGNTISHMKHTNENFDIYAVV